MDISGQQPRQSPDDSGMSTPLAFESMPVALLHGDNWAPVYCDLLESAESSIDVALFSISKNWPKKYRGNFNIVDKLCEQAERGIRCQAALATHKPSSMTERYNWGAAKRLIESGWRVRWVPPGKLLHAKFLSVDKSKVILGSHNISYTAATVNQDLSVLIKCPDDYLQLNEWFAKLFNDSRNKVRTNWPK